MITKLGMRTVCKGDIEVEVYSETPDALAHALREIEAIERMEEDKKRREELENDCWGHDIDPRRFRCRKCGMSAEEIYRTTYGQPPPMCRPRPGRSANPERN